MRLSRTVAACCLAALVAAIVAGLCVEAEGAKPRKKRRPVKPAQAPSIAVVGDQDPMPEYPEDDSEQAEALSKKPVYRQLPKGPEHLVTVSCAEPGVVRGKELRVLYADPEIRLLRLWPNKGTFDDAGRCRVSLPEGAYAFEVLGDHEGAIAALRSGIRRIRGPTQVALSPTEPAELVLVGPDGQPVPLREVAVRSGSASGEVRWRADPGEEGEGIELTLSPGQKYRVRAIGLRGETAVALWREIDPASLRIEASPQTAATCRFRWARGGPSASRGGVAIQFPDASIELPLTPQAALVTNRRFVTMSYWMELAAKRRVVFHERGYRLPGPGAAVTLDMGGPLRAVASGAVLLHRRPKTWQIAWNAELCDPAGHFVDLKRSAIDWKAALQQQGDAPAPGSLSGDPESLRALLPRLEAVVSYRLDGPATEARVRLEAFAPRQSPQFRTSSPPAWHWRTQCYLAKCERLYDIIQDVTGRKHPKPIHIGWHTSNVSLGGAGGIAMKFGGLRDSHGFYDYPWAICHEIMHAFRFAHGDEMRYQHKLVMERLRAYRWHVADHPEEMPGYPSFPATIGASALRD